MEIIIFYIASILAFAVGTAAIYMALIERFPVSWLYYHYFIRKPINWVIFMGLLFWTILIYTGQGQFPYWAIPPIIISAFAILLTYKMHQENAFKAVDFPKPSQDPSKLPIADDMQVALIEYEGVTKCYPLDYVIHHHIINDSFGSKTVSLTYCAMCRSIIPFDVTDIGPLFVASFKDANMIIADRKTKSFFQQATFQSIIGKLHPAELTMIPFQILEWSDIKELSPIPETVHVSKKDFKDFELPIPGIWKKITASESTPGLSSENRDKTFPARTHVIGIIDPDIHEDIFFLKKEIKKKGIHFETKHGFYLISVSNTVNAFKNPKGHSQLDISLHKKELIDKVSGTHWDLRGKYISGSIKESLCPVAISDEYWFSWKRFHEGSQLIRLSSSS